MDESLIAKEVEEFPEVLAYLEQHKLVDYQFVAPESPPTTPEASTPERPTETNGIPKNQGRKSTGKRAQATADLWEPIRIAAKTLWDQDKELSITEVVQRLKKLSSFKASTYTESAIRKRIKDLAPVGIRGKSGRKPKKPT